MSNILFYFYSSFLIIETDESTSNPNMVDVGCQTDLTWKDMESQAQYLQSVTAQLADLKEKLLGIQITEQGFSGNNEKKQILHRLTKFPYFNACVQACVTIYQVHFHKCLVKFSAVYSCSDENET